MNILPSVSLASYTTFRTGGNAQFFVEVSSVDELKKVAELAQAESLPLLILGEGSNMLISDAGFQGYVIRPLIKGIEISSDGTVVAGAGEHWDDVVRDTVAQNLSGLENLSYIPGSVGAAPVQNIGAYGSELKDTLEWVEVFDPKTGSTRKISRDECLFGYRESVFKSPRGKNFVVTRVAMKLKPGGEPNISYKDLQKYFSEKSSRGEKPTIAEVRDAVVRIRKEKLPDVTKVGTAGSFFKNPIIPEAEYNKLAEKFPGLPSFSAETGFKKIPLAWIIDNVCGLKGYREGDIGVHDTQALVIVNYGTGTSSEVKKIAKKITDCVKENTGINAEWEVNQI